MAAANFRMQLLYDQGALFGSKQTQPLRNDSCWQ